MARVVAAARRRAGARLPPGSADQRRRPALPRRTSRSSCCSPTTPARAAAIAERARPRQRRAPRTSRRGSASRPRPRWRAQGGAPAYVLAGEGWHPGVIGIVAARIAERHHRPTVLIAPDGRRAGDRARAARSPAFDLLGGLDACAGHLLGHGGHRAAAGLQIDPARIEAFRAAFVAHAAAVLDAGGPDRRRARRRRRLGRGSRPRAGRGAARPRRRSAPATRRSRCCWRRPRSSDPVGFGGEERPITSASPSARAARGPGRSASAAARGCRWRRGAGRRDVPPRAQRVAGRRRAAPAAAHGARAAATPAADRACSGRTATTSSGVFAELDARRSRRPPRAARRSAGARSATVAAGVSRRRSPACVATGEPVLVAGRRRAGARPATSRERLGGFALCSHAALARGARAGVGYDAHRRARPARRARAEHDRGAGRARDQATHLAWGEPELRFAAHIHEREYGLRASLAALYRALRDRGGAAGEELEAALRGDGPRPRSAALAGRLLRVLAELDLVELDRGADRRYRASQGAGRSSRLRRRFGLPATTRGRPAIPGKQRSTGSGLKSPRAPPRRVHGRVPPDAAARSSAAKQRRRRPRRPPADRRSSRGPDGATDPSP